MTGEKFPQPFNEDYVPPSYAEMVEVRRLYFDTLEMMMNRHASIVESSEFEIEGTLLQRYEIDLSSVDDEDEDKAEVVVFADTRNQARSYADSYDRSNLARFLLNGLPGLVPIFGLPMRMISIPVK